MEGTLDHPFVQQAVQTYAQTGPPRRALWSAALAQATKQPGETPSYIEQNRDDVVLASVQRDCT